jgi:hypothetical protein
MPIQSWFTEAKLGIFIDYVDCHELSGQGIY